MDDDIPNQYNTIFIEKNERKIEDIIDSYIDLFGSEHSEEQKRVALEMFADELSLYIATDLIKKQISKQCEVLQELREEQFNKR